MTAGKRHPALILGRLTPIYDLFISFFMPEQRFKRRLIAGARIGPGDRVLDIGAGTGTLGIMLKGNEPAANVTGIDGDPEILQIARRKASHARAGLTFTVGDVTSMPYPPELFERGLSSLVFSLLSNEDKRRAVTEAYRVIRPGGELHVADYGLPHTRWGRWVAPLMRNFAPISENLDGRLPIIIREAGFEGVIEAAHFATIFGTLSIVSGRKPD